jgi:hypothetical protein
MWGKLFVIKKKLHTETVFAVTILVYSQSRHLVTLLSTYGYSVTNNCLNLFTDLLAGIHS